MGINDKNILITGVSGFAGSYLAKHLIAQGANVYGLLRSRADGLPPRNLTRLAILGKLKLVEGDLENISSLESALSLSDPDIIFHLGAQSFIPRSFADPMGAMSCNCGGTANLLEAIRTKDIDPVVVFAGSSEEYGLVISSEAQYKRALETYGAIFPEPEKVPEVPISERNPLRPMSPYAVSKVYGDFLMRNYWQSYGIKTIVSRAFNHEGAGRGIMFVTSVITSQVMKFMMGEADSITLGNVNAFRDWSHILDIVDGYQLLAEKGKYGDVYNQGSMRANSVISYVLLSLTEAGYPVDKIETFKGEKVLENPLEPDRSEIFGINFDKTKIDEVMLRGEVDFALDDGGVIAHAGPSQIKIVFDTERFRPVELPITLSDTTKIEKLGFRAKHILADIIKDQLHFYLSDEERKGSY